MKFTFPSKPNTEGEKGKGKKIGRRGKEERKRKKDGKDRK